jgi:N,N'-diacetyllegionaminate synthase
MLKKIEVSKDQNVELNKYCIVNGIIFLTTPFDDESLKSLSEIGAIVNSIFNKLP